mmetsp:Transcript_1773/g.7056  ORF Transcript_1773/g.7056 Transcript_1773/m.7056 type:complete len:261 (-) Transcript_1773:378-1160(-)
MRGGELANVRLHHGHGRSRARPREAPVGRFVGDVPAADAAGHGLKDGRVGVTEAHPENALRFRSVHAEALSKVRRHEGRVGAEPRQRPHEPVGQLHGRHVGVAERRKLLLNRPGNLAKRQLSGAKDEPLARRLGVDHGAHVRLSHIAHIHSVHEHVDEAGHFSENDLLDQVQAGTRGAREHRALDQARVDSRELELAPLGLRLDDVPCCPLRARLALHVRPDPRSVRVGPVRGRPHLGAHALLVAVGDGRAGGGENGTLH